MSPAVPTPAAGILPELTDPAVRLALEAGLIDSDDIQSALRASNSSSDLAEVLVRSGRLRREDLERLTRLSAAKLAHQPAPKKLGRYTILGDLGQGGSAHVYLARDERLSRTIALKVLRLTEASQIARFLREARLAASLDHPNIVRVFDSGEDAGRLFIAMQHIDGEPLGRTPLSVEESAAAARDIARALQHAHERGILHRDVKPGNILRDRAGRVTLSDFGLGRLHAASDERISMTGSILGTPHYMAPEQASGNPDAIDQRSDIYSLGVTLYELLTGRPPYSGASPFEIIERAKSGTPEVIRGINPSVPRDLEWIVRKAMDPAPSKRYETASAFADDLERYISGEPIHATAPSKTRRWRWVLAPALLIAALAGWKALRNETPPPDPEGHWIYQDNLNPGWFDWSDRAEFDAHSTELVRSGVAAMRTTILERWGSLQFFTQDLIQDPATYSGIEFWVHPVSESPGLLMQLYRSDRRGEEQVDLEYIPIADCRPGEWQKVFVPMERLNPSNLPFNRILLQSDRPTVFFLDDYRLVPAGR